MEDNFHQLIGISIKFTRTALSHSALRMLVMVLEIPSAAFESDSIDHDYKVMYPSPCKGDSNRTSRDTKDAIMAQISHLPHTTGK